MNTYIKKTNIRRILSTFGIIAIAIGFIFSTPSPTVKNEMIRNLIIKIQEQNNIAYAQDDGMYDPNTYDPYGDGQDTQNTSPDPVYGCTDSAANNYNAFADTPDGSCTYDPVMGCTNPNALNYDGSAEQDDGSCQFSPYCSDSTAANYGAQEDCYFTPDVYGCTDSSYANYDPQATVDDGSCSNPVYGCMDRNNRNFDPLATVNDPSMCAQTTTYCCDGNWSNYTAPSDRQDPYECEYMEPTCNCGGDVFAADPNATGSQCGGGNDSCQIDANFSVIKSGVSIGGNATMFKTAPCTESDYGYLAGVAATDASPSTPLNTPVVINPFTTYTVTSKDYCLNVVGDQSSPSGYNRNTSGFCCEVPNVVNGSGTGCIDGSQIPQCGSATLTPTDTTPTSNLCTNGTPSSVTTGTDTFDWSCDISGGASSQCSVAKTCNGGSCTLCTLDDCGTDDVCKYIQGSQTSDQLGNLNLTSYPNGECYNSTSGVCGSQTFVPYATTDLTAASPNLCATGANVSSDPQYNAGTNMWSWTCATPNGGDISPTCSVAKCTGAQCQTQQSTGLIKAIKAEPTIVSEPTDKCNITWTSSVDSTITEPAQGCRLNDSPVSDNNTSGLLVSPGPYTLMCFIGDQFETKSVKCSVKPNYKEI